MINAVKFNKRYANNIILIRIWKKRDATKAHFLLKCIQIVDKKNINVIIRKDIEIIDCLFK